MNILDFSIILASTALLASAVSASTSAQTGQDINQANTSLSDKYSAKASKVLSSMSGYLGSIKSSDFNIKSSLASTGAKLTETFNSLANKSVKEKDSDTLERIIACSGTGSKDEFARTIRAYCLESKVDAVSKSDSNNDIKKDTNLSPHDLSLKKLIVLFNCPKANALLAELNEADLKSDAADTGIPDIVKEALKQKLLEFPFGSLQFDYDRTFQACVKSINDADHNDICKTKPCRNEDLETLEAKLASLEYCSHHFMKDSIKKIVEVLKSNANAKFDQNNGISRSKFLGIIAKIANTLPNIQIKAESSLNEGILEKTIIKCRANLQKLLNVTDPDVPSYDDLFKEPKTGIEL